MEKLDDLERISEYKADDIEIQNFFKSKKKLYKPDLINTDRNKINNNLNNNNFKGLQLKKLRIKMKLTHEKLGFLLGIDKNFISLYEKNIDIPTSEKRIIYSFFEARNFKEKPIELNLFNIEQQIEVNQKPIIMNGLDIIAIREEFGLTQQKLAEEIKVNRKTIMNWEKGRIIPENKIKLIEFILKHKRNIVVSESAIEKIEDRSQSIEYLTREILGLKDHINTLKELVEDKNIITEMYKSVNTLLKEKLAIKE